MYLNLDEMPIKVLEEKKAIQFIYQKKIYFFKYATPEMILKELVAEKIAKRFGVACCHYMPATYKGFQGVISESAYGIWDFGYQEMFNYLRRYNPDEFNSFFWNYNLEDIWNEFYYDPEIPSSVEKKLMDELTDIFIFDVLIANCDRHGENLGIIKNGKETHMAPVFDNDKMLSDAAINEGKYCLAIEAGETFINTPVNFLYKFLNISDKSYHERLKEGLKIISEESLIEILKELKDEGNTFDSSLLEDMLERFRKNKEMINNYFESKKINNNIS